MKHKIDLLNTSLNVEYLIEGDIDFSNPLVAVTSIIKHALFKTWFDLEIPCAL